MLRKARALQSAKTRAMAGQLIDALPYRAWPYSRRLVQSTISSVQLRPARACARFSSTLPARRYLAGPRVARSTTVLSCKVFVGHFLACTGLALASSSDRVVTPIIPPSRHSHDYLLSSAMTVIHPSFFVLHWSSTPSSVASALGFLSTPKILRYEFFFFFFACK